MTNHFISSVCGVPKSCDNPEQIADFVPHVMFSLWLWRAFCSMMSPGWKFLIVGRQTGNLDLSVGGTNLWRIFAHVWPRAHLRIATDHCNHDLIVGLFGQLCVYFSKVRLDLACGLIVIGMYVPNSGQKLARLPYRVNDTWTRTGLCRHRRFEICRNEFLFAKDLQFYVCLARAARYGTRCCCHICNNSIRKQLSSHYFAWLEFNNS